MLEYLSIRVENVLWKFDIKTSGMGLKIDDFSFL